MGKLTILFAVFFALAIGANAQALAIGSQIDSFTLKDADGKPRVLADLMGPKGAVIVFLSVQCPVVQGYDERIKRVAADYKAKGINFIGINSNATESLDAVRSHAAENYAFPVLIDKGNVLADKLGAKVTPEIFYVDAKRLLLYHGAIDNDRSGKNPTEQYLRAAFDASLAGKVVERTAAKAFGCTIKRVGE